MPSEKPLPGKCGGLITNWKEKYGNKMYCINAPGKGTDHVGTGKCYKHGGASKGRHGATRALKAIRKQVEKHYDTDIDEYEKFKAQTDAEKLSVDRELYFAYKTLEKVMAENVSQEMLLIGKDLIDSIAKSIATSLLVKKHKWDTTYKTDNSQNAQLIMAICDIVFHDFKMINGINDQTERYRRFSNRTQTLMERALALTRGEYHPEREVEQIEQSADERWKKQHSDYI